MNDSQRLNKLLRSKGLNPTSLAKILGIERPQGFYDIQKGKSGISKKMADNIVLHFPEVSKAWLLTGTEPMYSDRKNDAKPITNEFVNVPFVSAKGRKTYITSLYDMNYTETLPSIPVIIEKVPDIAYRCFEIDGDSMDDGSKNSICDKDIVLCREVKPEFWASTLQKPASIFYVLVHSEGISVKRIKEYRPETDDLLCSSLNEHYPDETIRYKALLEVYVLTKIVDRSTRF